MITGTILWRTRRTFVSGGGPNVAERLMIAGCSIATGDRDYGAPAASAALHHDDLLPSRRSSPCSFSPAGADAAAMKATCGKSGCSRRIPDWSK